VAQDRARPVERALHVLTHVLAAHVAREFHLTHVPARLRAGAAEDQRVAVLVQQFGQVLERPEVGRIDGRHVAQAQDDNRGQP
jgi:hypothetical protein